MSDEPPIEGWPKESAERKRKADVLRSRGIDPYPTRYKRTHTFSEVLASFGEKTLEELEALQPKVRIAGRVQTKREMGKASFATLSDGEARLQAYFRKDVLGPDAYSLLDLVDLGDFIGVAGRVMRTRKGELSVEAAELAFLSKALLPPPEKWHGLAEMEIRYRQRYLDLMSNPDVRRVFVTRSRIVSEVRRFMEAQGYIEVETPMMQPIPGGALARPFVTYHNALGIDLYMRIAPELYLKRLVVGGLERVFEINRNFRNEGISTQHNPEFTMLEFYTSYFDCDDVIEMTEKLISEVAEKVVGKKVSYKGRELSLARPFRRMSMKEAILSAAREAGVELSPAVLDDPQRLRAAVEPGGSLAKPPIEAERYVSLSHGKRIVQLFEDLAEGRLFEPTFITGYPREVSPLSKSRPDEPETTERFELYAAGMEIANGFSELNDPLEQRARFVEQFRDREKGDLEAHAMDEDYVRALGHGLPPTGGCGVGIDRLVMILTDSASIRDVILFPQMRPEGGRGEP